MIARGWSAWLRYCARPPFDPEHLELLGEECVIYRLPKPQRDGTTALSLTQLELIDHLAALISDLDSRQSYPGRVLPPLSEWLQRRFGHRSLTHPLLAQAMAALGAQVTLALALSCGWVQSPGEATRCPLLPA